MSRYHVPKHVQRHIDFIKPGVNLLEVDGVRRSTDNAGLQKRLYKGGQGQGLLPPIVEQLTLPLQALLGDLLGLCGVAITPPCIEGMNGNQEHENRPNADSNSHVQHYQG